MNMTSTSHRRIIPAHHDPPTLAPAATKNSLRAAVTKVFHFVQLWLDQCSLLAAASQMRPRIAPPLTLRFFLRLEVRCEEPMDKSNHSAFISTETVITLINAEGDVA